MAKNKTKKKTKKKETKKKENKAKKKAKKKTETKKKTTEQIQREKAANEAVKKIKSRFGEGAVMKLGERERKQVDAISTGCFSLDSALGVGGIPRGRVVEIFGQEMSGKTTMSLHAIAEAQKLGGVAAFIDAEHALDPEYAKRIGVNMDDLLISQPDTGEQALEIVETLVRSGGVDIIVVDSVAALTPKKEIEGEMGDQQMGLHARLMSQALRKLTGIVGKTNTTVIFLNQIRMKIGVYFGNPQTTTGGLALKFYSSVRIKLNRLAQIKNKDEVIGRRVRAKVVKNKVAPPFKKAEFEIMFNEGISKEGDILHLGAEKGIIKRKGNTIYYNDEKLGVGWKKAKKALKEDKKMIKKIKQDIIDKIKKDKEEEED
ncbi:MAG TPA: recombinase RecA [Patescibacteria group bacterium]|nr:recombinase RecA [Patescibacteria group bacterium]